MKKKEQVEQTYRERAVTNVEITRGPTALLYKYTLRQKFSIIICVKGSKNIWLELIPVNKYFDTLVTIRCHGNGGNN